MSNFKCKECGTVNIDCGKEGFKTTKEIELEKKLKIAEEALIEQDNYFKEIENIISKYKLTESVIKVTSINPLDVQEILNITRKAKGVK